MFCPHCGQQQVSDEGVRFCPRCGFQLSGVSALLASGGLLPEPGQVERVNISPRRKGVQQGAALILLGAVLVPLLGVLNSYWLMPEILVAIAAVICFIGGPVRLLYAGVFEEGAKQTGNTLHAAGPVYAPPAIAPPVASRQNMALPPALQKPMPVSRYDSRRVNTAEIAAPPSVTENTTRLLQDEPDESKR